MVAYEIIGGLVVLGVLILGTRQLYKLLNRGEPK